MPTPALMIWISASDGSGVPANARYEEDGVTVRYEEDGVTIRVTE